MRRLGLHVSVIHNSVRLLLPAAWLLAAIGYGSAWIANGIAGLTVTGTEMGEFVKFLPGVADGTLRVSRQLFYLPPFAIAVSIALLAGLRQLEYPVLVRALAAILALFLSVQLLPPAWSPSTLVGDEFRLQTVALILCWLLLAGMKLWGRAPAWLTGGGVATLALGAAGLSLWQFWLAKPAIDRVYGTPPATGGGLVVSAVGLALLAGLGIALSVLARQRTS